MTTEQHRHRCLVRQCLRWQSEFGNAWLRAWIKGYRGDREALRNDLRAQYDMGNRGARGDWRE